MRRRVPRIFCFEGNWSPDLRDRSSMRPFLEFLEAYSKAKFIHRDVNSLEELAALMKLWQQKRYDDYSLGYFAFHGDPGVIWIGRNKMTLEELGESLAGSCKGKTIHFGSCSVLDIPKKRILSFRGITGARCLAGYTKDIDSLEAAAFDLLLLESLAYYKRIDAVSNWLFENHGPFAKRLGFKMFYG